MRLSHLSIAQRVAKKHATLKGMTIQEQQAYEQGIADVLDAFGDEHPQLVYDMFTVRSNIEELLNPEEEEGDEEE